MEKQLVIVLNDFPSYENLNRHVMNGNASWLRHHIAQEFGRYIDQLPWSNNRIDYIKIGRLYYEADLYSLDEQEVHSFFDQSVLSKYSNVAFLYLDDFPLLIVTAEFARNNLTGFLTYPGDALAFGFNSVDNYCFCDFMVVSSWDAVVFKK